MISRHSQPAAKLVPRSQPEGAPAASELHLPAKAMLAFCLRSKPWPAPIARWPNVVRRGICSPLRGFHEEERCAAIFRPCRRVAIPGWRPFPGLAHHHLAARSWFPWLVPADAVEAVAKSGGLSPWSPVTDSQFCHEAPLPCGNPSRLAARCGDCSAVQCFPQLPRFLQELQECTKGRDRPLHLRARTFAVYMLHAHSCKAHTELSSCTVYICMCVCSEIIRKPTVVSQIFALPGLTPASSGSVHDMGARRGRPAALMQKLLFIR